jgi:hypothetical protein
MVSGGLHGSHVASADPPNTVDRVEDPDELERCRPKEHKQVPWTDGVLVPDGFINEPECGLVSDPEEITGFKLH